MQHDRVRRPIAASVVSVICVAGCIAFVLWQLDPILLFRDTTTSGGDTGAHVLVAKYLETHLLPHFQVTGWSPDWFDGLPLLTFYFPLPALAVVGLNVVVAYGVAFKLVTAAGSLALPLCAWALGRLGRLPRPGPECLAIATVPFLFDRSYQIYGGNLASTLAGEYDFSLALALALLFLGLTMAGLRNGRHRASSAACLAACALCHFVPALYAGAGATLLVLFGPGRPALDLRKRLRWGVPVGAVAVAITGFWLFPFYSYLPYTTSMGWTKVTDYVTSLFPEELLWALALAVVGAVASVLRRRGLGCLLLALTVLFCGAFVLMPEGKLYNARLLPFWFVGVYLLAGVGVSELALGAWRLWLWRAGWRRSKGGYSNYPYAPYGSRSPGMEGAGSASLMVGANLSPDLPEPSSPGEGPPERGAPWSSWTPPPPRPARRRLSSISALRNGAFMAWVLVPLVALASALVGEGIPLEGLPSWSPIHAKATSFIPDWVRWNYSGYQGKSTWPEYHSLMVTMGSLGKRYGCGRAMWEYGPELNDLGTTMALMLLPYWTGGCVDSMEGLLFESSATTPYHFINQAELSETPSEAMAGLPYTGLDVAAGVKHLQLLGVRYFMAFTPQVEQQASADPALRLLAKSGPWPTAVGTTTVERTWRIYLVRDSATVVPLKNQPVVMTGVPNSSKGWLQAAMSWYMDPARQGVMEAAAGPSSWARVSSTASKLPARALPAATVSDLQRSAERISFNVSRAGVPILVKTSYFPAWRAHGAEGPFRVAPNLMVVLPTSKHVVVSYGITTVEILGWVATAFGVVACVLLGLADLRRRTSRR